MGPKRFARLRRVLDRRQPDLTVLMERVNKSHNFSAILRNCDAVGILEVHVVPPVKGLELHQETSAGTAKWIRVHRHSSGAEALEMLKRSGHQVVAAHAGADSLDFREPDYTRPTALMMGAELFGLSDEALAGADVRIRIPMVGMARSLNVSVATALILYEAYRQRKSAGLYSRCRLAPERRDRILFEWAYPDLARRLRSEGDPYPTLDENGAIRD